MFYGFFDTRNSKDFVLRSEPFLKAARCERALKYREQRALNLHHDYDGSDYGQLNAALVDGTTCLVRSEFLISQARLGGGCRFTQRCATPSEAFYHGPIYEKTKILAYSYQWYSAEEPDNDGVQLQDLAVFLEFLNEKEDGLIWLVYVDIMSTFGGASRSSSLFFVHPLCYTLLNRRTPPQRWAPKASSSRKHDVIPWTTTAPQTPIADIAHEKLASPTSRNLISQTPGWGVASGKVSFLDNGWTYFQCAISNMKKGAEMVLDLGRALDWIVDSTLPVEERTFGNLVAACHERKRNLVKGCSQMNAALATKHFFHATDAALLARDYEQNFKAVLGAAKALDLRNMDADPEEWGGFVRDTLPSCLSLEVLDLSHNPGLVVDASLISEMCPPKLRYLHLHSTGLHGAVSSFFDCERLEHLVATETKVSGAKEDLTARTPSRRLYIRLDMADFEV